MDPFAPIDPAIKEIKDSLSKYVSCKHIDNEREERGEKGGGDI